MLTTMYLGFMQIFFTAWLAIGYFPKSFKKTREVMIPKSGKKSNMVESYRPLSLLEVPRKLLERITYEIHSIKEIALGS